MELLKKLLDYIRRLYDVKDRKKLVQNTIIIIIIGIIIIIAGDSLVGKKDKADLKDSKPQGTNAEQVGKILASQEKTDIEKKMEQILTRIEGAGKVDVMVTYVSGNEIVPAYDLKKSDSETQEKDNGGGTRNIKQGELENKIVYEEAQGGNRKPVIVKELQPLVKGVVVVADGAPDPVVKEKLCRAVQVLVDLPAHKIQVFERQR